jgi:hypothetical protein
VVGRIGDLTCAVLERVHMMPADQVEILLAQPGRDAGVVGAAVWASVSKL